MEIQEEQWGSLVRQAEQMERKARQRAVVFSLIPVILAGLLLWFTSHQIQQANRQLVEIQATRDEVKAQLAQTQDQLDRTRTDLTITEENLLVAQQTLTATGKTLIDVQQTLSRTQDQLTQIEQEKQKVQNELDKINNGLRDASIQLGFSTDFLKYAAPVDWVLALKEIASYYPQQSKILVDIYYLREARWKLGGFSPEEGFDSPSFAAYVLGKNNLIKDPASNRYQLQNVLPRRSQPQVGDVVFYQSGYTMFFFKDEMGNPFVLGMTPVGVLALKPDFAPVTSYGAVDYQSMR
jgi:hypothetical protein